MCRWLTDNEQSCKDISLKLPTDSQYLHANFQQHSSLLGAAVQSNYYVEQTQFINNFVSAVFSINFIK